MGSLPAAHPGPLPWGEGESLPDLELAKQFWFLLKRAAQFPLPKGEGQGEEEPDVSNPAHQQGPQGSRVQARNAFRGFSPRP